MDRYVTDIKNGCYQNPVLPMDFSDPDAIRVGEDYYLISSSFTYLPACRCCTARILSTGSASATAWSVCRLTAMPSPPMAAAPGPGAALPCGRFYAFIPLPDEGIFYTEATDPAGPGVRCTA